MFENVGFPLAQAKTFIIECISGKAYLSETYDLKKQSPMWFTPKKHEAITSALKFHKVKCAKYKVLEFFFS